MSAQVLESAVAEVTVYRRGAIVLREAVLRRTGDAFPDEIRLTGLPLGLEDASLRLEVTAIDDDPDQAVPIAGDVRITVAVPDADSRLPPPDDEELEAAALEHARATRELEDLQGALESLRHLDVAPRGQPEEGQAPAPSPTGARLALLSFRNAKALALHERIEAAKARVHETHERVATLRERRRIASSDRNVRPWEIRKAAVIRLDPPQGAALPSSLRIRLRYAVAGARWAPSYVIRLDPGMATGSLQLRAVVGQATGEDWRGVRLVLSTAVRDRWTELPELKASRIGRVQPEPARSGWRPPPSGAAELYADYDRDLPRPPSPVRPASPPSSARMTLSGQAPPGMALPAAPPPAQTVLLGNAAPPQAKGAPPPAPAAAPVPPTLAPASRASGIGALIGGAIDGLASFGRDEPGPPPSDALSQTLPASSEVLAGRELLEYGRLRLFGPDDARRGRLHRVEARVVYEEIALSRVSIELAVEGMRAADAAAHALEQRNAPERHVWPASEEGFDYVYEAQAPVDLASDGKFHGLAIASDAFEAQPRFIAVPRETQDVYRVVGLRNPLVAPLLPGPADVYVNGRFVLTSEIELTPVGGRIELGLGVEQAIKIARNVEFVEDTSGLIKRQLELRHTLRIEIVNHLARSAHVEVRERLPIAAAEVEDDIEIEELSVDPAWEDYVPRDRSLEGGKVWKVEVGAGAKRNLSATWVARIPSQQEVIGGNRREG